MNNANIGIDWDWVKDILEKKERIPAGSQNAIAKSLCNSIEAAKKLASPEIAAMKKMIMSFGESAINIVEGERLTGSTLASHLRGSTHVHLFIVTLGPAIENKASALMKKADSLSGYLLDRIGSFAVESLAENLERALRAEYESKGQSVSMRFSPGYCDWPIEEQVKLNALLDFSKAGVRLNKSCMMKPTKSISGVIGIGPRDLFFKKKSQCVICSMKSCAYRRA